MNSKMTKSTKDNIQKELLKPYKIQPSLSLLNEVTKSHEPAYFVKELVINNEKELKRGLRFIEDTLKNKGIEYTTTELTQVEVDAKVKEVLFDDMEGSFDEAPGLMDDLRFELSLTNDKETIRLQPPLFITPPPKKEIFTNNDINFMLYSCFQSHTTEFLTTKIKENEKKVDTLKQQIKEIEEIKKIDLPTKIKTPLNFLNNILTTRDKTLEKLNKSIKQLEAQEKKTNNKKEKDTIAKQIKKANDVFMRCSNNFPDNFEFSVYEHYAIFGAFKLLSDNNFQPIQMYFTDILKALNFNKSGKSINKSEISKIRDAFKKLTTQKFPCYLIRETKKGSNKYDIYDHDEPLFKIKEINQLDLNIEVSIKEINKNKMLLSLENLALIEDLKQFHTFIHSNILSNFRDFKNQIQEKDLYFLEYLVKEKGCRAKSNKNESTINLIKLCKILRLKNYLNESKDNFKNRLTKSRLIKNIKELSAFMIQEKIIKTPPIFENENVTFKYTSSKKNNTSENIKKIKAPHLVT